MSLAAIMLGHGGGPGRQSFWRGFWGITAATFIKCDPRVQFRNPVLFIVWLSSVLATVIAITQPLLGEPHISGGSPVPAGFTWVIAGCLWLTVLAANLAEAVAEGRGRSQAAALRSLREGVVTHRVRHYTGDDPSALNTTVDTVDALSLRRGDVVVLQEGDVVPSDGEVIWGVALVDESAITGESARVIRESGGDRSAVTGGTKVVSDRIVVRVTVTPGETVVDRMTRLAEGAHRQKPPNELALNSLLAALSIAFIVPAVTIDVIAKPVAPPVSIPTLMAMVGVLIPTEIAALLAVTGIASTYRLLEQNVLVLSGHALETAGDITTVLLDKTGTITQGDRQATEFVPLPGVAKEDLIRTAALASIGDPTPEGTSIVKLAAKLGVVLEGPSQGTMIAFSAQTRLSGRDIEDLSVRKGAETSVLTWLKHIGVQQTKAVTDDLKAMTNRIAQTGATPLVVAEKNGDEARVLGVVNLKDVVKHGVISRVSQLKALGVRTVMVTGDNPVTARAIAGEAGFDEVLGDATPEDKLALINKEQASGHFVAMTGDGTNDAPALAQADIGVAMSSATPAAKEAANFIVMDDDPTKLVEIIDAGRRQMTTRGALTTFNIANDIVRYFTFFPAFFVGIFPGLDKLNILHLHTPASAIISTVLYSVLVIFLLIPMALAGVPYRLADLGRALDRNLLIYGVGGIIIPIIMIKAIDMLIALIPGY
ncbi:MAG: potassium-transporting ATPase subunit KdpB [Propionibacteriaceae bacterium]|nr:potassium-transporting ATPase subunit KdpB [Propionibacteriaceae bacterium]